MKRRVLVMSGGVVLMVMTGLLQAAEMRLEAREKAGMSGVLRDGMRVMTGRIVCRESHTGFYVWMLNRQVEARPGHYIVQGRRDSRHEMRVRLEGDGWSPGGAEGQPGMVNTGPEEQAVFDVVADGGQHVAPDEYIFTVTGKCL